MISTPALLVVYTTGAVMSRKTCNKIYSVNVAHHKYTKVFLKKRVSDYEEVSIKDENVPDAICFSFELKNLLLLSSSLFYSLFLSGFIRCGNFYWLCRFKKYLRFSN